MEVLESVLAEFIGYIKSKHSRMDQRRGLLRQLVRVVVDAAEGGAGAAVRDESFSASLQVPRSEALRGQEVLDAAAVASSARRFLAALFVCNAEVDRLTKAVEDDIFVRVLSMDAARAAATEDDMDVDRDAARAAATEDYMDVDGRPEPGARHRKEGSDRSCASAGSVAALLPSPGAKRKRVCGGGEVDTVQPQKRRLLAWTRSHQRLRSGFGRVSSAARKPPPAALPRSRPARTVALAYSRFRRRIGRPTTTRHRPQPSLGQHFSRITL
ncbi:unnamed protein product [Miscanthus lutarioriparius]|uniref:Uncharacterized protein n=1 Tax=Miscanthus lutarioriparius TaxID=422564 RepID=A0A811NXH4_9POAL|nr:unnamed protein product [Miscanthus lutarioriparius]